MPRGSGRNPSYDPTAQPSSLTKINRSRPSSPTIANDKADPRGYERIQWPDAMLLSALMRTEWIDILGFKVPKDWKSSSQNAKEVYQIVRKWIVSYRDNFPMANQQGFQVFRVDWRIFRHTIPLQMRLIIEQALFDLGNPWRSLCSGFSPLKD